MTKNMSPTMNIRKGIIKGWEMKQTVYEQFGGTYREDNGYLIPGVELPEQKPIGKYGPMQLAPSKSTGMEGSALLDEGRLNSRVCQGSRN